MDELIIKMAYVIESLLTCPIAFYSHSSGAGIALELVRFLRRNKNVEPIKKFMVGGWRAPHLSSPFEFLDAIPDEDVYLDKSIPNIKRHLRALEIPDSVIENKLVFEEMLPSLRADILLGKKYKYYEDGPLRCPLTAIAGEDDSVFTEDQIKAWENHTSAEFSFRKVKGGHLFCRDNREELLELIAEELMSEVLSEDHQTALG